MTIFKLLGGNFQTKLLKIKRKLEIELVFLPEAQNLAKLEKSAGPILRGFFLWARIENLRTTND